MTLEELIEEITEFMQLDEKFKLTENINIYSEWDSMVTLSVLALFDDEFEIDASDKLAACVTFQDVINLVSDKLDT